MKRVFAILLCLCLILAGCGAGTTEEGTEPETKSQVTTEETTTATTVETTEATTEETQPETTEPDVPKETYDYNEDLAEALIMGGISAFAYQNVECTETEITVSISVDNASTFVANAKKNGVASSNSSWQSVKDNITSIYGLIRKLIDTGIGQNVPIYINLVGDQNHDDIFISSLNGEIIFDILDSDEDTVSVQTESTSKPTEATVTLGEKNALRSAKDYLELQAFSYDGLVKQLEFEQYSHEEAVYAADNCGADWYEQAAKSAKEYLDFQSFSKKQLIDQLKYEKFTQEQAEYGVAQCGY